MLSFSSAYSVCWWWTKRYRKSGDLISFLFAPACQPVDEARYASPLVSSISAKQFSNSALVRLPAPLRETVYASWVFGSVHFDQSLKSSLFTEELIYPCAVHVTREHTYSTSSKYVFMNSSSVNWLAASIGVIVLIFFLNAGRTSLSFL